MNEYIIRFDGKYRFLSNFYPYRAKEGLEEGCAPLKINHENMIFPSSEHAFQAAKSLSDQERMAISKADSAYIAKKMGRKVRLREDWEQAKVGVLREILLAKFSNEELKKQLKDTGNAILVEGNYWHDHFYGVCYCDKCMGVGKNMLGELLMEIRRIQ